MISTIGAFVLGLFGWVFVQVILHESAHLLAARMLGFSAFAVTIGTGRQLFRRRLWNLDVRVHWLPLFGIVWVRPFLRGVVAWRGALFSIAGLVSDALLLVVLLYLIGLDIGSPLDYFLVLIIGYQVMTIVSNFVPVDLKLYGNTVPSDGKQFFNYLRGHQPAGLQMLEVTAARYDPGFRLEDSWFMRADVEGLTLLIDAQQDAARGRHAEVARKYRRIVGEHGLHPAEKAMLLDAMACIAIFQNIKTLLPEAETWARQVCELVPQSRTVRGTLGAVLVDRDKYAEGLELLMPLTSDGNTPLDRGIASCFAAKALHRLGRAAEARSALETARKYGAFAELYARIEAEMKP